MAAVLQRHCPRWLASLALLAVASFAQAGGGVVLSNDSCIMTIGFYEAHFTAYQSETRGDEEFCEDLPDATATIFVLDYLHSSLSEVPVDFRIIRNSTGKREFARMADIEAQGSLEEMTVFYQSPQVRGNGTLLVEYRFDGPGEYIGIVTAGHPTTDRIYTSVFPFEVGASRFSWGWLAFGVVLIVAMLFLLNVKRIGGSRAP